MHLEAFFSSSPAQVSPRMGQSVEESCREKIFRNTRKEHAYNGLDKAIKNEYIHHHQDSRVTNGAM